MNTRPFRLMVVADDRKTLRHLARFLTAFGFDVDPLTDVRQAVSVCSAAPPDFLIIDGDSLSAEQCRQLLANIRHGRSYTFLMLRDAHLDGLTDAMVAGVDDFLAKPVVFGELLARLRSGARVIEYARRMHEQAAVDPVTGLLSFTAFRDRLASELADTTNHGVSCVLLDVDHLEFINRMHGCNTSDEILRAVAGELRGMANDCKYLASFGQGRFAALLPDASDARALAWAEMLRQSVAQLEIPVHGETVYVTASLGVAGSVNGTGSADELIQRAETAVRLAKSSGRNCVARCGQFDGETREWEDLARQGRLFENTVARDVMVPCPQFVVPDQEAADAAKLLERSRLTEVPVVDRQGRLLGLLSADQLPEDTSSIGQKAKVGDFMIHDVTTVPENESFAALMELFMSETEPRQVVIVVRHDQPLGMVYRSGLAALSEPLSVDSFVPDQSYSLSSEYLVVPDPGWRT
jgi:two-component system, cell cycle response regulator